MVIQTTNIDGVCGLQELDKLTPAVVSCTDVHIRVDVFANVKTDSSNNDCHLYC